MFVSLAILCVTIKLYTESKRTSERGAACSRRPRGRGPTRGSSRSQTTYAREKIIIRSRPTDRAKGCFHNTKYNQHIPGDATARAFKMQAILT